MTTGPMPDCFKCKHFHDDELTCEAFPNGIPDAIYSAAYKHDKPMFGQDNDIVFEPK